MSWNDLNNNFVFGEGVSTKARIWLFASFVVAFGAMIAAFWVAITVWFTGSRDPETKYGGVALIVQNVAIFLR